MEKKVNEVINPDFSFISGDLPKNNPEFVTSTKTGDEMRRMVGSPSNFYDTYGLGLGYMFEEDDNTKNIINNEQVLPKKEYNAFDMITKTSDDNIENLKLPNIFNISNPNIVNKLKAIVSLLNADDKEIDKVAVLSDFIKEVNFENVNPIYKKELLKQINEKL